jgi:hypothetical protein
MTWCQFSLMLAEGGCEPVETRKTAARPWEIDDELWARIEPLLPVVCKHFFGLHHTEMKWLQA